MKVITIPLGPVGLFAVLYLGVLFANFSRRLGAVTKMAERYRWFVVSNTFIALAATSQMVRGIVAVAPDSGFSFLLSSWFALITFHIPLAIGMTLDLVLVWHYWSWILKEKVE